MPRMRFASYAAIMALAIASLCFAAKAPPTEHPWLTIPSLPLPPAGLSLPVQLAPVMSSQPAKAGEVFLIRRLSLDYRGGPVTLAGDAEGTCSYSVDDQLTLRITHPDGTTSQYQDAPEAEEIGPLDVSSHFQVGLNEVEVELRDLQGGQEASTEIWLSDRGTAPAAAAVPLGLVSGIGRCAQTVPLRLPVRMVQAMADQPTKPDPVFYAARFSLDYRGGPITLAADADGTRDSVVDDQLTLRIVRPDGTVTQYQDSPSAEWSAPTDLAEYFQVGVNQVEVELRDFGDVAWCTDLWLSDHAPVLAQLPLELFAGEPPQSFWPAKETVVTVTGPEEGQEVVLAGDRAGRRSTWVTGQFRIRVRRADGTVKNLTQAYRATPQGPEALPPLALTSLLGRGANRVEVYLEGRQSGVIASSPFWLTTVAEGSLLALSPPTRVPHLPPYKELVSCHFIDSRCPFSGRNACCERWRLAGLPPHKMAALPAESPFLPLDI